MSDYTDNDGNPISQRFFTDPEWPKRIYDATVRSFDDSDALEVVGWRVEGEAWRYANEIAAMLNEAVRLRRDAEPTAAARDVLAERQRQIEAEGWTPEHDDEHSSGEMAAAAGCYAFHAALGGWPDLSPYLWPWDKAWWKPTTPRRTLVKAGALILAEIERLDRAAEREGED
ncbi:hypothetical protein [Pseudazoarcus pumilus]|uniref:hypothetical protein n=1 Tax=Pseudazoarcus pumilus TaxID=2067960 RepID=UPI0015706217|nr:hypothetical protein [Pseudazoarcus pumilus]